MFNEQTDEISVNLRKTPVFRDAEELNAIVDKFNRQHSGATSIAGRSRSEESYRKAKLAGANRNQGPSPGLRQ